MRIEKGSDITKNVKIIEWIKNEILISEMCIRDMHQVMENL